MLDVDAQQGLGSEGQREVDGEEPVQLVTVVN